MKGIFWGIGVGPGDPELITWKAIKMLEKCTVWVLPDSGKGVCRALEIVKHTVSPEGKTLLFVSMPMVDSQMKKAHEQGAKQVAAYLEKGLDAAFVTLGDVSIYSTFSYLEKELLNLGYTAMRIAGVPSFCAAAAALRVDLALGKEPLHVFPGGPADWETTLPGTKIYMKVGKALSQCAKEEGDWYLAVDCGMPTQALYEKKEEFPQESSYFSIAIQKRRDGV